MYVLMCLHVFAGQVVLMFSKAISRGAARNKCRYVLAKIVIEAPETRRLIIDQSKLERE